MVSCAAVSIRALTTSSLRLMPGFQRTFGRGQRPAHKLQFRAALTLAEAGSDFSNDSWPCGRSREQGAGSREQREQGARSEAHSGVWYSGSCGLISRKILRRHTLCDRGNFVCQNSARVVVDETCWQETTFRKRSAAAAVCASNFGRLPGPNGYVFAGFVAGWYEFGRGSRGLFAAQKVGDCPRKVGWQFAGSLQRAGTGVLNSFRLPPPCRFSYFLPVPSPLRGGLGRG